MARICTIGARGGSKGVKGKNIRPLAGMPLIAHSIRQGKECGLFDVVAVSSDSPEILEVAREYGADEIVERPAEMATDTAPKLPAIRHCAMEVEKRRGVTFDTIVELDPTAPLRLHADIKGAIDLYEANPGVKSVITATDSRKSPYFNMVELDADGWVSLSKRQDQIVHRRQEGPRVYEMNASIYVWNRDVYVADPRVFYDRTLMFHMPHSRSVDVDVELDFAFIEFLVERGLAEYD